MTRGLGVTEWLVGSAGPLAVLFAVLTQLGDYWLLVSLATGAYWLGPHAPRVGHALDRDRAALVLALLIGSVAITASLKAGFALSRPPGADVPQAIEYVPAGFQDLYTWLAGADGYGFPSGHAVAATIGWGGLAWAVRAGRRRTRIAVASLIVAVVALSRLVLGLHYLVDVVVGVAVGATYLALVVRLRRPAVAFGLALGIAVLGAVFAGLTHDLAAGVGVAAGATLGWSLIRSAPRPTRRGAGATIALGLVTAGPLVALAATDVLAPVPTLLAGFAGTFLLVALPLVGERLEKRAVASA